MKNTSNWITEWHYHLCQVNYVFVVSSLSVSHSVCLQQQRKNYWSDCHWTFGFYLGLGVICFTSQDAEVPWGGDCHQAFHILDKLLVVFGVPEYDTVLLPLWFCVGVHNCAATVAPLFKKANERDEEIHLLSVISKRWEKCAQRQPGKQVINL